jgi:multidrug efflux pump subunit AcrA (membrane-fusion protein)
MPEAKITQVEVERETDISVWINGHRNAKRSEWNNYYDTWEEAKAALQAKAQSQVDSLRLQLERAKGALGNIKGMSC